MGLTPRVQERQLFLSRRVVTEEGEFDGGVLVNETGFIEGVLTRESVNLLLSQGGGKYKVGIHKCCLAASYQWSTKNSGCRWISAEVQ